MTMVIAPMGGVIPAEASGSARSRSNRTVRGGNEEPTEGPPPSDILSEEATDERSES